MSPKLEKLMNLSPVWKQATDALNEVVNLANASGKKIPAKELAALREFRILMTMACDPAVQKCVADDLWEAAQAKARAL